MPESFPANPRPASTVVVLRDGSDRPEIFLVRRHERTAFMGGAHVFPGGRVDPSDATADPSWCDGLVQAHRQLAALPTGEAAAYHVAAARELFEEAGALLARTRDGQPVSFAGDSMRARFRQYRGDVYGHALSFRAVMLREQLRLALDELLLFAHWVTPPIDARQFDTRFFMARLPRGQVPAHDQTETTHSAWMSATAAIEEAEAGRIVLPPPTWTTLRELESLKSVDDAMAWARGRRVVRRQPELLERDGRRILLLPGDPLHSEHSGGDAPHETRFVSVDGRWRAERART